MPVTSLRHLQSLGDSPGNTSPSLGLDLELLSSLLGQAVVFRAAIVFRVSPKRGNPAFVFHAVQGREERARLDDESTLGDLLNSAGNAQSVHLAGGQRFQDEQIQSTLQQGSGFRVQESSPIEFL